MKEAIYIIGGGSSIGGIDLRSLRDKITVTVNKSLFVVPDSEYFITVDYSFVNKFRNRILSAITSTATYSVFIANMGHTELKKDSHGYHDTKWDIRYNLSCFNEVIESPRVDGIGVDIDDFRTGDNSGFCAMQLAVLLGYTEIYLLGIDLHATPQATHFHGGYGQPFQRFESDLERYYTYFKTALEELAIKKPDVKVYSCSPSSRLNNIIPYVKL